MKGKIISRMTVALHRSTMIPDTKAHLQFGLCIFFLKNKHSTVSGENVERAPLCNYVNHVIKLCAIGNEFVIQIIDG